MQGLLITIGLHLAAGWVGAQIAAALNRGRKLGFWATTMAGFMGGALLGQTAERVPQLAPALEFLGSGPMEEIVTGVVGGFVFGLLGSVFGRKREKEAA